MGCRRVGLMCHLMQPALTCSSNTNTASPSFSSKLMVLPYEHLAYLWAGQIMTCNGIPGHLVVLLPVTSGKHLDQLVVSNIKIRMSASVMHFSVVWLLPGCCLVPSSNMYVWPRHISSIPEFPLIKTPDLSADTPSRIRAKVLLIPRFCHCYRFHSLRAFPQG